MEMLHTLKSSLARFAHEEDGSQVIEYALIIAVVSIALVVALQALTASGGGFSSFITRVTTCLTTPASCA
jgi:pilus assembly protein Flp/PilA